VYPPSSWQPLPVDSQPPDCVLHRDFVYGYNGACKRSLHFISDDECVYPVAALVVIQSLLDSSQQRFFEGHSRSVTCVDWNEHRSLCASGQTDPAGSGGPYICIWAPEFCDHTISELHHHERVVQGLAMSPDGQIVVSFGGDESHTMCIWRDFARWDGRSGPERTGMNEIVPPEMKAPSHSVASGRVTTKSIFMGPCVLERGRPQRGFNFYTIGEPDLPLIKSGSFRCWSIQIGRTHAEEPEISQKRGVFGKAAVPQLMTCIAHSDEPGIAFMVGDNGYFYVLSNGTVSQSQRITPPKYAPSLGCVKTLEGGRWIAGASDGSIYLGRCDPVPHVEETLRVADLVGPEGDLFCSTAPMRLAAVDVRGARLLLGTSNHALFEADLQQRGNGHALQVSHTEEAWALDFHPSLAILATGSNAKDVRFWNVAERRPAVGKVLKVENSVASMSFSPEGSLLALGCCGGFVEVHGFPSLQPVFKQQLSRDNEHFCDVRFSNNGAMLAAACWDQSVYILKVEIRDGPASARVALHKVLTGNSSSPLCVMFSADGEYVMSNSKDTQILCWKTKDGSRHGAISAIRDTPWQQPWTNVLGWPVIGLWGDPEYDQTDVNSVCQSSAPKSGYIALGDDYGKVKLFRYPSPFLNPPCHVYGGHGAHVTHVKFSKTNVLAALGGDDHSISQWSLDFSRAKRGQPQPVVHPWVQFDEAEGVPTDSFGFLGRPRATSAPRVAPPQRSGHRPPSADSRRPPARTGTGRAGPRGRRSASASGSRGSTPTGSAAGRLAPGTFLEPHSTSRAAEHVRQAAEGPSHRALGLAAALPPREPARQGIQEIRTASGGVRNYENSSGVASAMRWD